MTTVGIVSPGAMGSAVGRFLVEGGSRVVATVAGRSERTTSLAQGLELLPTLADVVAASEVVLSVVPPGEARSAACAVADAARRSGARPLVADLNATAPATVREIAADLELSGLEAVDGSISGPPPRAPGTTRIYLSGPGAERVAALPAPGLEIRIVGAEVGTASAVKMSTASFYKGQAGLLVQALRAARANGVLGPVVDDLRSTFPQVIEHAPGMIQSTASKSGRFVAEMEQIAASQGDAGLTPALFLAFAEVYEQMSSAPGAAASPEQVDPAASLGAVLESLDAPAA